jgi:hypothetical protein
MIFSEMDKRLVDGSDEHLSMLDLTLRIAGVPPAMRNVRSNMERCSSDPSTSRLSISEKIMTILLLDRFVLLLFVFSIPLADLF